MSDRIRDMPSNKLAVKGEVSQKRLTFTNQVIDTKSKAVIVSFKNVGYDSMVLKRVYAVGDFEIQFKAPAVLEANQSFDVSVVFAPKSRGLLTGGLTFDSGDAAGEEFVILQGSAIFKDEEGSGEVGKELYITDIVELPEILDKKSDVGHSHKISEIEGLNDRLEKKQDSLGYAAENAEKKGKPAGYASLDNDGMVPVDQLPPASGLVPETGRTILLKLKQVDGEGSGLDSEYLGGLTSSEYVKTTIIGQKGGVAPLDPAGQIPASYIPAISRRDNVVYLTDGQDLNNPPADWTELAKTNLARAVAQNLPFVVPAGRYLLSEKLVIDLGPNGSAVTILGYGKKKSMLVWSESAASSGIEIYSPNANQTVQVENVGLIQRGKAKGVALTVDFAGQIVPNNGNPVAVDRSNPRGHIKSCYIGGDGNPFQQGWLRGVNVVAPVAFHVYENDFWGVLINNKDYVAETAIHIGSILGVGHPVECYVERNRIFHFKKGVEFEGMEGAYCNFNQIIGINIGIHFNDNMGRPQLIAIGNHINHAGVGILVDNCYQFTIHSNLIYLVTDANMTGAGVIIRGANSGCGQIMSNQFENTDTTYSASHLNSIIIESGKDITIDLNVYRRSIPATISGVWLTNGAQRVIVGSGEIFNTQGGQPLYRVQDNGSENMCPGYGVRMGKNGNQNCTANQANIITFDSLINYEGNPGESWDDGAFIIPSRGLWIVTAGIVTSGVAGAIGNFLSIFKNSVNGNPIAGIGGVNESGGVYAAQITSGPVLLEKNDVLRIGYNPGAAKAVVPHQNTFVDIRRLS